MTVEK
ncbi:hypothetical protein Bhyg_12362 [Pseudolycoriella hygida]|jgi:hypothetical protein